MFRLVFTTALWCLSFCLPVFTSQAHAQAPDQSDSFAITLQSRYTIQAAGKTLVEQKFLIRNKSPEFFVSRYGIVLSSTNIDKIQVSSNGKELVPQISHNKGQTSIGVTFDEPVVGEGKTRELLLSYIDLDVAMISGKILEVNIPQVADAYPYEKYQLELYVPNIFDTPSRISPSNFTLEQTADYNILRYDQLDKQAVSAIFGHKQVFDVLLNYELSNQSNQNSLAQIALPPDTPWQEVYYHQLDPPPKDIKEDRDGNVIATYEIPANNAFSVQLLTQITLNLQANPKIPGTPVLSEHLAEQKFFDTKDSKLQEIASTLNSVKDIYDYTVNTLNYTTKDLSKAFVRLGAATAIQDQYKNDATCQEFTDLFISLARIKGIPTRRVVGYAYSNNEELRPSNLSNDILHTWPEYYDREQSMWRAVDPTWESTTGGVDYFTKFDLNHLVLAINGVSSQMPSPAASYKTTFTKEPIAGFTPEFSVALKPMKIGPFDLPNSYQLEISNHSGKYWYFDRMEISGENLQIEQNYDSVITKILPFAKINLPINVYNTLGQVAAEHQLNFKIILQDGQSFDEQLTIYSYPRWQNFDKRLILYVGGGFVLLTLIGGSLFLLGRKGGDALRRKSQKLEEAHHQLHQIASALQQDQTDGQSGEKNSRPRSR